MKKTTMNEAEFSQLLRTATSEVKDDYFSLKIYKQEPVYRERVYCYELYHQMRLLWPKDSQFFLNGEVDKMNHEKLAEAGLAGLKPDFLVHIPGNWNGNHIVMEVKSANVSPKGLSQDIHSLNGFMTKGNYGRALLLIFGTPALSSRKLANLQKRAAKNGITSSIEIWQHTHAGTEATLVLTLNPA